MSEFRGHQEIVKYHVAVLNIGDPWEGDRDSGCFV